MKPKKPGILAAATLALFPSVAQAAEPLPVTIKNYNPEAVSMFSPLAIERYAQSSVNNNSNPPAHKSKKVIDTPYVLVGLGLAGSMAYQTRAVIDNQPNASKPLIYGVDAVAFAGTMTLAYKHKEEGEKWWLIPLTSAALSVLLAGLEKSNKQ